MLSPPVRMGEMFEPILPVQPRTKTLTYFWQGAARPSVRLNSGFMFLCSKYGVRSTASRDSIKGAVSHAFAGSVAAYL